MTIEIISSITCETVKQALHCIGIERSKTTTHTNMSISRYIPPEYFIASNRKTSALCAKCSNLRPR